MTCRAIFAIALAMAVWTGCDPAADKPRKKGKGEEPEAVTNRIAIPSSVRTNLGITFEKVEQRAVSATLRVPGRFELEPSARHEIHTTLSGRVELTVRQYQRVEPGATLFRLDSPMWRETQGKLLEAQQSIRMCIVRETGFAARLATTQSHQSKLETLVAIWTDRVAQVQKLIEAGSGAASELTEARSQQAAAEASLAEVVEERSGLEMELLQCQAGLAGYKRKMPLLFADVTGTPAGDVKTVDLALTPAAALLGLKVNALRKNVGTAEAPVPLWQTIDQIEVKAHTGGVVEKLAVTPGGWVEPSALVMTLVDPRALRFRAIGLQSDLARLKDGLTVSIVPPRGGARQLTGAIPGTLTLGLEADADQRRIDLLSPLKAKALTSWARAGVAAEMEITTAGGTPALAIPLTAVVKDGLQRVFFRRDPRDPDKAIRIEADLGADDGRWIVVNSGVKAGDEVVNHGAYELMLTGAGADRKGGHFHADGTFHKGED